MKRMSARPHHLGSAYDKDNAEWILSKFKEWGWDARIENYDVLFPTPKERLVEMVAPSAFKLKLEEPAVAVDPTSGQKTEQLPSFNAYSIDGDVTAPLVYVNYGRPQDYDELDRRGISVKGRDRHRALRRVVARHQAEGRRRTRRGRLPDLLGPEGRRLRRGRRVPRTGRCGTADGVQRGSVMDMPTYPGDPLTPGVGATPGARRLDDQGRDDADEDSRCCRFRTATRSRCCRRCAGRWRPATGAARCRSRITSARARRAST